jgi:hypothetical protein
MRKLGIMNHTQRHFRASQLADVLDPFELKRHYIEKPYLSNMFTAQKVEDSQRKKRLMKYGLGNAN